MKSNILIKDLICFGAVAEAYSMDTCKLDWNWKYACGCEGNLQNNLHNYEVCEHQDNLFWSERFTSQGRTIKMGMQQDEVVEVKCIVNITEEDVGKLRALTAEAEELLGEDGMEFYDIFLSKVDAMKNCDRLSVVEEHQFYTKTKDWYLKNDMTPIRFEEIKFNTTSKFIAHKLLNQLVHNKEATVHATWFPALNEDEPLLFEEHEVKITECGHVTPVDKSIKAEES
jgi:hypothetical protein